MNKKYVLEKLAMQLVRTDEQILQPEDPLLIAALYGGASGIGTAIGAGIRTKQFNPKTALSVALVSGLPFYYLQKKINEDKKEDPEKFLRETKEGTIYKFFKGLE